MRVAGKAERLKNKAPARAHAAEAAPAPTTATHLPVDMRDWKNASTSGATPVFPPVGAPATDPGAVAATAGAQTSPRVDAAPTRTRRTLAPVSATTTHSSTTAHSSTARPADGAEPLVIPGAKQPRAKPQARGPQRLIRLPRAARLLVGFASVAAVVATLLITTPLGQSAGAGGTFVAYANSVSWITPPTATPKPPPPPTYRPPAGANPGQQAIIDKIVAIFGPYAPGAINIARCESDFDPNSWNSIAIGGSHASGVFQILYPSTWKGTSYAGFSPYDADANIHAAYEIFKRDGNSWREWACHPG